MRLNTHPSLAWLLISVLALSACKTPQKEIFKADAPSMASIIGQSSGRTSPVNFVGMSQGNNIGGYTRDAANEIYQLFPTVNNPTLLMFVFPHITDDGNPVPGYSTAFPMYDDAVQFALPGENP